MYRPIALYIGLRYTRAKRRNHFISFISLISVAGIALGVAVLITVLSVMNGFDAEIKKRVFSMVSPITISSDTGYIANWQSLQKIVQATPGVVASAPFVSGEALLSYSGGVQPALLTGILPKEEQGVSGLASKMTVGMVNALKPGQFGIILGENLAARLGATIGDLITVITPQGSLSPAGFIPRFKRFKVMGVFKAGNGFGFDVGLAFTQLNDAQTLFGVATNVTGLHVNIQDVYQATSISEQLVDKLAPNALISNWTNTFGDFFRAVQLEKTMMFLILLLIIAVAAFNLVSTLVMAVNEKHADIAILRTLGANPRTIMAIFMIQGGITGIIGTLLGLLTGLWLASHVTDIVNWIQRMTGMHFFSGSVFWVNYLPSVIDKADVINVCLSALILSLLATLYPAWHASRLNPVESLRYE
jgi:lipoprotein-releasing system permease protein